MKGHFREGEEAEFSDRDFDRLSRFLYKQCGIQLPLTKKSMLSSRLQKRIRLLGLPTFTAYVDRVVDPKMGDEELIQFLDAVTATKSDFFQDPGQFEYLTRDVVPGLIQTKGVGVRRPLVVWSVGCATGEEPYTLSIVLKEFSEQVPGINFKGQILATDISARALEKASTAIYEMERVAAIPLPIKKKYLLKSRDPRKQMVRISPDLRAMVRFRQLNLMDPRFGLREPLDAIFCRNVVIYFDQPTQERVINKLCQHLAPGGHLFVGQSEKLDKLHTPLVKVAPTIYRLPE
ncbi:MAG: chemotaxis protein CheR [Magnetococcales bacterium]|nr:chemotaxis protein CheR [Magnetococcales bacterium]